MRPIPDAPAADVPPSLDRGRLVIAVATFRRPDDLARCLTSLRAELDRLGDDRGSIVVVDNDPDGSGREVAAGFAPLVTYVVEATPGISAARNRALDEAGDARLLVFVDDDEEAEPGWLGHLVATWERDRPAAVAGRVVSAFPAPLDPWIEAGGFFRRRTLPTGTAIGTAATNNLLLDLAVVGREGLRFDDAYGLTGGGDTDFTRRLVGTGAAMVWCDEAVVVDHVPAERATRDWVCRRARRTGNSEVVVGLRLASGRRARSRVRLEAIVRGLLRVVTGGAGRLAGRVTGSPGLHARGTKALFRGRGMLAAASGRSVAEYTRAGELRVLTSFPRPTAGTNPYIAQLATALGGTDGLRVRTFGRRSALLGRYDVVHLHWPEILVGGTGAARRTVRLLVAVLLAVRWRFGRAAVVRTVHNVAPHENPSLLRRAVLRLIDAAVDVRITLNPVDPLTGDDVHIAHGHYVDWFAATPAVPPVAGRVVFAGLVRRYKNVGALVEAFGAVTVPGASLRVVGRPADTGLAAELTRAAGDDDRVSLDLRFLDDAELAAEIGAAALVVLPYRDMRNSGATLLALSLGRPVLVPDNEINRALADEVGPQWVRLFAGRLGPDDLAAALTVVPTGAPDLSARGWRDVGTRHRDAYRAAVARRAAR